MIYSPYVKINIALKTHVMCFVSWCVNNTEVETHKKCELQFQVCCLDNM